MDSSKSLIKWEASYSNCLIISKDFFVCFKEGVNLYKYHTLKISHLSIHQAMQLMLASKLSEIKVEIEHKNHFKSIVQMYRISKGSFESITNIEYKEWFDIVIDD